MKKLKLTNFGKVIAFSLFAISLMLFASDSSNTGIFLLSKLVGFITLGISYAMLKKGNVIE